MFIKSLIESHGCLTKNVCIITENYMNVVIAIYGQSGFTNVSRIQYIHTFASM